MDYISTLKKHPEFSDFVLPIDKRCEFRDATYYLRKDGTFIFSEGYAHDLSKPLNEKQMVSHIVYVPADNPENIPKHSKKLIFGQNYENITKDIMNNNPADKFFPLQFKRYVELDSSLDRSRPPYAKFKAMIPVESLVGFCEHRNAVQAIIKKAEPGNSAYNIKKAVEAMPDLLNIKFEQIGMSGSLCLGAYDDPHDLDVVIYGTAKENRRIIDYIRNITIKNEDRRVYEFGKFWPIRYYETIDNIKMMICPFFSYLDTDEIPLRDFEYEVVKELEIEANVSDHTHNSYNPAILELENIKHKGGKYINNMKLVIYHGGERGDFWEGDRLKINGHHLHVQTYKTKDGERKKDIDFDIILVTNFGQTLKYE